MPSASYDSNPRGWPPPTEEETFYAEEASLLLPGWPGYRNRVGRSGLDPLDNQFEWAQMQGRFVRALFTARLRSDEPAYLALMALAGLFNMLLACLPLLEILSGGSVFPLAWCCSTLPGLLGFLLLLNLVLNLHRGCSSAEPGG